MSPSSCKIVVLISGTGTNLQALIDACGAGEIPGQIVAVIGNRPGAGGLERARRAGIPAECLDHRDYATREAFDQALMQVIDRYAPDLVCLAGFMRILTPAFTTHYLGRMLNIHPSLLPDYRGLHTHARALADGVREHGASVHFVTPDLDGGPVVVRVRVPVHADDTPETLAARVLEQEHRLYPAATTWFCAGRLKLNAGRVILDGAPLDHPLELTEVPA
ncbi:MAG: phosphoribosylglycinamide formyltransferase [Gammaproteobacteria bacterium]|jgi:phosphoribosylglycinamide formyltransferase-1